MKKILLIIAIGILLPYSKSDASVTLSPDDCTKYSASVEKVTDGDTLVVDINLGFGVTLNGAKIRMYGINTPESRTRNALEKIAGLAAKERLIEILESSQSIEVCVNEKKPRGKFGRVIAILFADGRNVNQALVDEGHAKPYFGGRREPWAPEPTRTPSPSGLLPLLDSLGYMR